MQRAKRIIQAVLAGLVLLGLIAMPAMAAYYCDLIATNLSATDYAMFPLMYDFPTESLASNGYMDLTGYDTRVGGGAFPHMLANNKLLYADLMSPSTSSIVEFTTGNSLLSSFYILTGYGGYLTTGDNAILEPGANFAIEMKGYLNGSVSTPAYLVYKNGACQMWQNYNWLYVSITGGPTVSTVLFSGGEYTVKVAASSAFPTVMGRSSGIQGSDSGSHSITLPVGILDDELLLVIFSVDGNPTCTASAGWTKLGQTTDGLSAVTQAVFYKFATGSDALTVNTTVAEQSTHVALRISGACTPTGTAFSGNGANSDPPNHNPGVAENYLWVATRSGDAAVVATVAPAGYANLQTQAGGADGASTNTAERLLNAAAEDPGTFTSNAEQWVCYTISVPPAGLRLYLDDMDIPVARAALGGASAPDTAYSWVFGTNNAMPYMEYLKITTAIGGYSEKLWWQPRHGYVNNWHPMFFPMYVGAGAVAHAANGNVTPALPANWRADDIFICIVASLDNVNSTLPAGWTAIDAGTNNGAGFRFTAYWRRAAVGDVAPVVTHAAGAGISAVVVAYRGCVLTGNPIDILGTTSVNTPASTTLTFSPTGITTLSIYDNVILLGGIGGQSTSAGYSLGVTEKVDGPNVAARPEVVVADFGMTGAGDTGAQTSTITSFVSNGILVSLKTAHQLINNDNFFDATTVGFIVWGANPSGVSSYADTLLAVVTGPVAEETPPPEVAPPINEPAGMYPSEEEMSGVWMTWLYPVVSDTAQQTNTPIVMIWYLMCAVYVLSFMAAIHRFVPNMLLTGIGGLVAIGTCVGMAFLPSWFIILATLFIIGLLVMERAPQV